MTNIGSGYHIFGTGSNSITIKNHNFVSGQKIIYTSSLPSGGLANNQIYYIVVVDSDTIKLSNSYFNSKTLNPIVLSSVTNTSATLAISL